MELRRPETGFGYPLKLTTNYQVDALSESFCFKSYGDLKLKGTNYGKRSNTRGRLLQLSPIIVISSLLP